MRSLTECKIAGVDADIEICTDRSTSGNQQKEGVNIHSRQDRHNADGEINSSWFTLLIILGSECRLSKSLEMH
jgi:hypothetical protein